jgi:hypothetical protein
MIYILSSEMSLLLVSPPFLQAHEMYSMYCERHTKKRVQNTEHIVIKVIKRKDCRDIILIVLSPLS